MWIYIWIMFLRGNKCSYLTKFSIVYTHHSWISKLKIILRSHRKYFKYNYLWYSYTQSYNLIYVLITDCTHILFFIFFMFFPFFFSILLHWYTHQEWKISPTMGVQAKVEKEREKGVNNEKERKKKSWDMFRKWSWWCQWVLSSIFLASSVYMHLFLSFLFFIKYFLFLFVCVSILFHCVYIK